MLILCKYCFYLKLAIDDAIKCYVIKYRSTTCTTDQLLSSQRMNLQGIYYDVEVVITTTLYHLLQLTMI